MRPEPAVIAQVVRRFLSEELQRDLTDVTDDASLLEAGVLDSRGVLSLVSFVERHYGLRVADDDLLPENFETIDAIAAFVGRSWNLHAV
jgi:acyl carrier protein